MKVFIGGSLVLIITYAVLLKGSTDKLTQGSSAINSALRRFLEPGVAGIGNHVSGTTGSSNGGGVPVAGAGGQLVTIAGYRPPTTLKL